MMSIALRELTRDNWRECIALAVADGQVGFVAPNVFSLAQAKVEPERVPLAIYDGDTMVGFVMYNDRPLPDGTFRLSRLMIDRRYQGRGYGRAASEAVIQRLHAVSDCHEILLDYARDNVAAAHLYGSLGFQPIAETVGEIVARLLLPS
jgi:diamine N-acetyltransferase